MSQWRTVIILALETKLGLRAQGHTARKCQLCLTSETTFRLYCLLSVLLLSRPWLLKGLGMSQSRLQVTADQTNCITWNTIPHREPRKLGKSIWRRMSNTWILFTFSKQSFPPLQLLSLSAESSLGCSYQPLQPAVGEIMQREKYHRFFSFTLGRREKKGRGIPNGEDL